MYTFSQYSKENVYKCHENNVTLQKLILNCVKIGHIKKGKFIKDKRGEKL